MKEDIIGKNWKKMLALKTHVDMGPDVLTVLLWAWLCELLYQSVSDVILLRVLGVQHKNCQSSIVHIRMSISEIHYQSSVTKCRTVNPPTEQLRSEV